MAERLVVDAPAVGIDATAIRIAERVSLTQARCKGPLVLTDARIGGALIATDADIDGGATSFAAAGARFDGRLELSGGRFVGEIALADADLRGPLVLVGARIFGTETAIAAPRASFSDSLSLDGLLAMGRIDLTRSEVEGEASFAGATLKVERGPALVLADARVRKDLALSNGLHTIGAVEARGAHIAGTLDLRGSHLRSAAIAPSAGRPATGHMNWTPVDCRALSLAGATVGRLVMPERGDERPRGIVDLSGATVDTFEDYAATWPPEPGLRAKDTSGHDIEYLVLDRFAFKTLVNPTGRSADGPKSRDAARARITWLDGQRAEDRGPTLSRQPWLALIGHFESQGLLHEADRLTIALKRRERRSRAMRPVARWSNRLADVLMLYGLSPWRALALLAVATVLMAGVWTAASRYCNAPGCLDESVFVITNKSAYTEPRFERTYPRFNALGYAADLSLPLVRLGYRDHWRPNAGFGPLATLTVPDGVASVIGIKELPLTAGGLLLVLALVQQLIGLVLSLAIIASLLGLARPRPGTHR